MKVLLEGLRSLALLLVLVPGLLLGSGAHLSICLHDWLGFQDACSMQLQGPAAGSCCAPAADVPVLVDQPDCGGCCLDLDVEREVLASASQSQVESQAQALDLPRRAELLGADDPGRYARPLMRSPVPHAGPGRAPTPLRI